MGLEVLIFMLSMNCQVDFEPDLWSGFDAAMSEEWNINAETSCHEVDELPSSLHEYKSLAKRIVADRDANSTATAGQTNDFTNFIDRLLGLSAPESEQQVLFLTEHSDRVFRKPLARGIAYPTENMAFVENNFEYSTATVSHELLHLVLEEQGHEKSCYVDMVHENMLRYELKQMGDNKLPILKKFDC